MQTVKDYDITVVTGCTPLLCTNIYHSILF
jgi:hypothetical protein